MTAIKMKKELTYNQIIKRLIDNNHITIDEYITLESRENSNQLIKRIQKMQKTLIKGYTKK